MIRSAVTSARNRVKPGQIAQLILLLVLACGVNAQELDRSLDENLNENVSEKLEAAGSSPRSVDEVTGLPVLTPAQLENYQFENPIEYKAPEVGELSLGQQFVLGSKRREMKEIISRRLGVMSMEGDLADLETLQQLIDRKVLDKDDIKDWQSLGVLFGDILANTLNLHWVGYKDEFGESKALQWKKTLNFVFPMTMFSRRVQFDEEMDVLQLYMKVKSDIAGFTEVENRLKQRYQPGVSDKQVFPQS